MYYGKILLIALISAASVGCPKATPKKNVVIQPEPPKPPPPPPQPPVVIKALWLRNFEARIDLAKINFAIFSHYHLVNSGVQAPQAAISESLEGLRTRYNMDMPSILNRIQQLVAEIEKLVNEKEAQIEKLVSFCSETTSCEVDSYAELESAKRDLTEALRRLKTVNVSESASVQAQAEAIQEAYNAYHKAQEGFLKALKGKDAATQARIQAQKDVAKARFENGELALQLGYANQSLAIYTDILHLLTVIISGDTTTDGGIRGLPPVPTTLKKLRDAGEQKLLRGTDGRTQLPGLTDKRELTGEGELPSLPGSADRPQLPGRSEQPRLTGTPERPMLPPARS